MGWVSGRRVVSKWADSTGLFVLGLRLFDGIFYGARWDVGRFGWKGCDYPDDSCKFLRKKLK